MRQFYGHPEKCVLSAGKTHVHKIPPFRGGGYLGLGGGECRFYFDGRGDFSEGHRLDTHERLWAFNFALGRRKQRVHTAAAATLPRLLPKDLAVLKVLRRLNHYGDSNLPSR